MWDVIISSSEFKAARSSAYDATRAEKALLSISADSLAIWAIRRVDILDRN